MLKMNNISNWVFGSFFRTLGRVLLYACLGLVVAYFGSKIDWDKIRDFDFRQLGYKIIGIDLIKADTKDYYLTNSLFTDDITDFTNYKSVIATTMFDSNFNYMKANSDSNSYSYVVLYNSTYDDYIFWIFRNTYSQLDLVCTPDGTTSNMNTSCTISNSSVTVESTFHLYKTSNPNVYFNSSRTLSTIDNINARYGYLKQQNTDLFGIGGYCVKSSVSNGSNVNFTYNAVSYNCDSPNISYDPDLYDRDFYLFYNLDDISSFDIFSSYDFTSFTDFEKLVVVAVFNIFYLLFIGFIIYIIIKILNKMLSWLF